MTSRPLCALVLLAASSFLTACSDNNITPVLSSGSTTIQHLYALSDPCSSTSSVSTIVSYPINSSSATGTTVLTSPAGQCWTNLQIDSSGNFYVVSVAYPATAAPSILVFAATATGTATPTRSITSSYITREDVDGMIVAASGTIFYADDDYGLEVYPTTATGVSIPTVIDDHYYPEYGAVDSAGNLYFSGPNEGLYLLPANFAANATASTITSSSTIATSTETKSVTLDSSGNAYLTVYYYTTGATTGAAIVELPHTTAAATVTPTNTFTLPSTASVTAVTDYQTALDTTGNIYVVTASNSTTATISEFATGATGTPTATNTYSMTLTQLDGIVIH